MRKALMILAMTLLLTGCADTTELGDRAIIQLAAIDYSAGEYKLNALLFSAGGSGGEVDVTQTNVIRAEGSGSTLGEAVQALSLADGKDIYMSETKLIVLGDGFVGNDVSSALTMLYRDMRCSLNTPVCCAGEASMLAEIQFTEGITSAEKPVDMIENAYLSGASPKATLLDVLSDSAGGRNTLVPYFVESTNGSGMTKDDKGGTAALDGARLISGGKLGARADSAETVGAMLLAGMTDSVRLSFMLDGREYSCEAYGIAAQIQDSRAAVDAKFRSLSGKPLTEMQEKQALRLLEDIAQQGVRFTLLNMGR